MILCLLYFDRFGSWACENALSEALTRGDDGEVTVFGHFAESGGFSVWKCFCSGLH
jgi:hypothetical protein